MALIGTNGHAFGASDTYPAYAAPPPSDVAQAPATLDQDSFFLRVSDDPGITIVNADTLQGQGPWSREVKPDYEGGAGCFSTINGKGDRFKFNGVQFVLFGCMNTLGGSFSVTIDGAPAGTGSCYAATPTKDVQYTSPVLSLGVHEVIVLKLDGTSIYRDTVILS
ncbi:hypothetical protein GCM10027048_27650 [Hymenobacter coalescens]